LRRELTDHLRLSARQREDSTILGDYGIDEIQVSRDNSQVREYSTRYDDDNDALGACLSEGRFDVGG
jgi:hypothetical protein